MEKSPALVSFPRQMSWPAANREDFRHVLKGYENVWLLNAERKRIQGVTLNMMMF